MTTEIEIKYFTVNSFMNHIQELTNDKIIFIHLYFIPSYSFRNQFNNMNIKPIAMLLKTENEMKNMKYNDMINYLNCFPVISFKQTGEKRIYKKQQLQKFIIYNEVHTSDKGPYYNSKIITVNDEKVINIIKADLPEQNKVIKHDDGFDEIWINE